MDVTGGMFGLELLLYIISSLSSLFSQQPHNVCPLSEKEIATPIF